MSNDALDAVALALCCLALAASFIRWLRVAQREHYLAGTVSRFAFRWWASGVANRVLLLIGVAAAVLSAWRALAALGTVVVTGGGPIGLGLRGRTSKLNWTPRLRRLAATGTVIFVIAVAVPAFFGLHPAVTAAALSALAAPVVVDLALAIARPVEGRLLAPYVERARRRLVSLGPRVVAITGSYGKTTTKGYIAHLLSGTFSVVATPASFNNTAGLARAVNEHLSAGTQVFVAEMGTYGPGEISEMCRWATPEVAVITAIGPVHLERMKTLERIAEAKAEILGEAGTAILNVDYPLLEQLADKAEEEGKTVWRCSSGGSTADVRAIADGGGLRVVAKYLGAEMDVVVPGLPGAEPGNVACAVAVALALGVPPEVVAGRVAMLPGAPHRRSIEIASNGSTVIDDTYNSNPAGAKSALSLLATLGSAGGKGKRVVVTPGMVELGPIQARENANFVASAASVADLLVIVGRTNAKALEAGARAGNLATRRSRNRAAAVAFLSGELGDGDAVLFENDLPDHYP
ncbi:MAG TPA: UDP-N-acetylmuramoyl-tripeptide--D-alanyl-D-alanine ligase [Acidimicrobiales bacterium]|nr:UDP-N-acetylmuramoyl-tripeptide--D-alanyl-D-alanine ligase [Acidimicrobiales bacterium]